MKKAGFVFCVHNHQPVGNQAQIIEDAYRKAYEPFIGVLEKHPSIKATLHYSGSLIDWFLEAHPDFIDRICRLAKEKQVELMAGGYYEPILAVIPDADKTGQIQKLKIFLKDRLGCEVSGMWLAERVWEPHLVRPIAEQSIKYTVLDDDIFAAAGQQEESLQGYFVSEEQGLTLNIFPISKKLRYLIPFEKPEDTIEYLRERARDDFVPLTVLADDGEKFGVWPRTYNQVYENGWLEIFFKLLEQNSDWLTTTTFSRYLAENRSMGRVYLPTASYSEMMKWALPTNLQIRYKKLMRKIDGSDKLKKYKQFLKGAYWRNFLVKYPESNNMHKKMLLVSRRVHKMSEGQNKEAAKIELWKGQNNDAYWHGVFGGVYLNELRRTVYNHLINAEVAADNSYHKSDSWIEVEKLDFDKDGFEELLVSTPTLNVYFDTQRGGTIFEFDYKPKSVNLLDTLARRPEAYHQYKYLKKNDGAATSTKLTSIHETDFDSKDFEKYLKYDWYRRVSLIDHFFDSQTDLVAFKNCDYEEIGNFVNQPYESEIQKLEDHTIIKLSRTGKITSDGSSLVKVIKTVNISAKKSEIVIDYEIKNISEQTFECWFGVEFNYAVLVTQDLKEKRYYYASNGNSLGDDNRLLSAGENPNISMVGIKDEWLGLDLNLRFSKPARIWRFPIETVSKSEKGLELIPQSSVLMPNWKIRIEAGGSWAFEIKEVLKQISAN